MTPKEQIEIEKLSTNVHRLMEIVLNQKAQIQQLEEQLEKQKHALEIEKANAAIANKRANAIIAAKSIATSPEEVDQTSLRIEALISDIDRCITLLESE